MPIEPSMPDLKLEELKEETYCVFVAPDGYPQLMTIATDFKTCLAMTQMLAEKGVSEHPAILFKKGYQILPVKVTLVQDGTAEAAFQRGIKSVKKT